MTIREMINKRRTEVEHSKELQPVRASEILVELSALMGNVTEEIRKRDMEYNRKFLEVLKKSKTAKSAQIEVDASVEYELKREAKDLKDTTIEMIRSLKYYLRAKGEEYEASTNL